MSSAPARHRSFGPDKAIDQSVLTQNRRLRRRHQPPQCAARRAQPRRADAADRLRRHRGRAGAESPARGFVVERSRAGNAVPAATIWRRPSARPQVVKPPRFNAYYGIEDVKPVDGATWKLELAGRVDDKRPWTRAADLRAAGAGDHHPPRLRRRLGLYRPVVRPESERFSGTRRRRSDGEIRLFPLRRRLSPKASTWRPRCTRRPSSPRNYADETIADPFGFPLRLRTSTKLGYKNAKWIKAIEVTNTFTETFWSKQGFNWFAGI